MSGVIIPVFSPTTAIAVLQTLYDMQLQYRISFLDGLNLALVDPECFDMAEPE
jgi:hypothetical protein